MAASHAAKNQRDTIAPLRRHQKTEKPPDPSPTIFIGSPLTTAGTAPVLFVEDDSRKKGCIAPLPVICYSGGMNNAIALAKKLEREHGFDQPQAEGIAQAIHDHESEHLATKADLARLEAKLETGLAQMDTKLAQLQVRLMTWTTVLAGIIIAVLKFT